MKTFGPALVCLLAVAAALPGCAANSAVTTTVPATADWHPTGITVAHGDTIKITASGQWTHGHEGNMGHAPRYGPEGWDKLDQQLVLPGALVGALVGRIGDGPPFLVGARFKLTASRSGELFLGINEIPGPPAHENNAGQLVARIEHVRLINGLR